MWHLWFGFTDRVILTAFQSNFRRSHLINLERTFTAHLSGHFYSPLILFSFLMLINYLFEKYPCSKYSSMPLASCTARVLPQYCGAVCGRNGQGWRAFVLRWLSGVRHVILFLLMVTGGGIIHNNINRLLAFWVVISSRIWCENHWGWAFQQREIRASASRSF